MKDILLAHLSNMLNEFEAQFDLGNNLDFTSPEFAWDYLEAAKCAKSLGRTGDRIVEVEAAYYELIGV